MSVRLPSGGARRDDDEVLDRIGHGDPVDGGGVERMLSNWRTSMPVAGPADERLLNAVSAAVTRPHRGHGRRMKVTAGVAAAVLLVGGGVAAAAAQARPGSPLWPVTELVFGGLADSRAALDSAETALREAKLAAAQGRVPEADRLLTEAAEHVEKIDEPAAADRLRDDIASMREQLQHGDTRFPSRTDATLPSSTEPPTSSDTPSLATPSLEGTSVDAPSVDTPGDGLPPDEREPSKDKDKPTKTDLPVPTEPPSLPNPTNPPSPVDTTEPPDNPSN